MKLTNTRIIKLSTILLILFWSLNISAQQSIVNNIEFDNQSSLQLQAQESLQINNTTQNIPQLVSNISNNQLNSSTPVCISIDYANTTSCLDNSTNAIITIPVSSCNVPASSTTVVAGSPTGTEEFYGFKIYQNGTFLTDRIKSNIVTNNVCDDYTISFPNSVCNATTTTLTAVPTFYTLTYLISNPSMYTVDSETTIPNCSNEVFDFTVYPYLTGTSSPGTNCAPATLEVNAPAAFCGIFDIACNGNGTTFTTTLQDSNGCYPDIVGQSTCSGCPEPGCTDPLFCNYNPSATTDDGSCAGPVSNDMDCDGIPTATDCDDNNASVGSNANDMDCDGVPTAYDCDDNDPTILDNGFDYDCDGVNFLEDCDDFDATIGSVYLDNDCDGVLTADDCDDLDYLVGNNSNDLDCDGVITIDDCDDNDPTIGINNLQVNSFAIDTTACFGSSIFLYFTGTPNASINVTFGTAGTYNILLDANGNYSFGVAANASSYTATLNSITLGNCTEDLSSQPSIIGYVSDCSNDCTAPASVSCGDVIIANNTNTTQGSFPDCIYGGSSNYTFQGQWFEFIGDGNDLIVSTCNPGTNFNTLTYVYEGTCSNLICAGSDNNSCSTIGDEVTVTTTVGTSYLILIAGFSTSDVGTYEVTFDCTSACPPTLTLGADPQPSSTYQAENWIQSTSKVNANSGGTVDFFVSYEYIELQSAFEADGDANFNAEIKGCGCPGISYSDFPWLNPNDPQFNAIIDICETADGVCYVRYTDFNYLDPITNEYINNLYDVNGNLLCSGYDYYNFSCGDYISVSDCNPIEY